MSRLYNIVEKTAIKKKKKHDKQRHVKDLEQQIIKVSLEIMIEEEKV